jgi:general secretion pathway protein G
MNSENFSANATLPPSTSGLAIGSLVCGILGFFTLGFTGFIAVVLGHMGLSRIRGSSGAIGGRGLAIAGLITGYIGALIAFIVLIVLAVTGGAIFAMKRESPDSKELRVRADFLSLQSALSAYRIVGGNYPTTDQGFAALVEKPTRGPIPSDWSQLRDTSPLDPWERNYVYKFPGSKDPEKPEILSIGPDGIEGTSDDISSQSD